MKNCRYHNECIRRNQAQGGSKPDPPSFFPWRLQWGLFVFQCGSNPHNPPANFYPGLSTPQILLTVDYTEDLRTDCLHVFLERFLIFLAHRFMCKFFLVVCLVE